MALTSLIITTGGAIIVALLRYLPNRTRIIATCTDGSRSASIKGEPGMTLTQALVEALNIRSGMVDLKEGLGSLIAEIKYRNDIIVKLESKTDAHRESMHDEYRDVIHVFNNNSQTITSSIQLLTMRLDQFLKQVGSNNTG